MAPCQVLTKRFALTRAIPRASPKSRNASSKRLVIGCPLGHAASDSDGVSAVMKEKALKILQRINGWSFWGCGRLTGSPDKRSLQIDSLWLSRRVVIAKALIDQRRESACL